MFGLPLASPAPPARRPLRLRCLRPGSALGGQLGARAPRIRQGEPGQITPFWAQSIGLRPQKGPIRPVRSFWTVLRRFFSLQFAPLAPASPAPYPPVSPSLPPAYRTPPPARSRPPPSRRCFTPCTECCCCFLSHVSHIPANFLGNRPVRLAPASPLMIIIE